MRLSIFCKMQQTLGKRRFQSPFTFIASFSISKWTVTETVTLPNLIFFCFTEERHSYGLEAIGWTILLNLSLYRHLQESITACENPHELCHRGVLSLTKAWITGSTAKAIHFIEHFKRLTCLHSLQNDCITLMER